MMIPTEAQAIALMEKYGKGNPHLPRLLKHVLAVKALASELARKVPPCNARPNMRVDMRAIVAGSILHDIGRLSFGPGSREAIRHGIRGAEILRKEGIDESIARICERHIGIGIRKQDIASQNLPLPERDFIPETPEERIIAYADNLIFGAMRGTEKMVEDRFEKLLGEDYGSRVRDFHAEMHGLLGLPNA